MNQIITTNRSKSLKELHRMLNFDGSMKSINTARSYTFLLNKFSRYLEEQGIDIMDVNKQVVIDYMTVCKQNGEKKGSVNNNVKAIKRFYGMLQDKGFKDINPCDNVSYFKEEAWNIKRKWLDTPALEQIFDIIKTGCSETNKRDYAIVLLLSRTGVRASELCNLKFKDIMYEGDIATELKIIEGKGGKNREIEIEENGLLLVNAIMAYRAAAGLEVKPDDYIFYTVKNNRYKERKPMSRLTLYYLIKRIGEKVGIENLHPHNFRHTFITHLLKNGCPIHRAQEGAGHSSITTTMIYTHDNSPYSNYLKNMPC